MLIGRYRQFLGETEHHVDVLTRLIGELGGDPFYVSPAHDDEGRGLHGQAFATVKNALTPD